MKTRKTINGIGEVERSFRGNVAVKCECGKAWVSRPGRKCIKCVRERKLLDDDVFPNEEELKLIEVKD